MRSRFFVNTHFRTLDAKGRLILPPEYREGLKKANSLGNVSESAEGASEDVAQGEAQSFWLTGFYGRLIAYMPDEWEKISEQLCKIPFTNVKLCHFKSKVMGLATLLSPDSQGRIRIPQPLMREAGLEKDVVLVGMLTSFEIWDQHRFDAIDTTEDMSEALAATGLTLNL